VALEEPFVFETISETGFYCAEQNYNCTQKNFNKALRTQNQFQSWAVSDITDPRPPRERGGFS